MVERKATNQNYNRKVVEPTGHPSGCPFHLFAFRPMGRNRFLNLSKFRYPYAASIMVWATSFPASIFASLGTTPNSFFASPLAFSRPPMPHGRTHRPIRRALRRDRKPVFHPKRKATMRWNPYGLLSRRFFSIPSVARGPFPLTETAKSYNNQGGWAKSSTTIEVIEPKKSVEQSALFSIFIVWSNIASSRSRSGGWLLEGSPPGRRC